MSSSDTSSDTSSDVSDNKKTAKITPAKKKKSTAKGSNKPNNGYIGQVDAFIRVVDFFENKFGLKRAYAVSLLLIGLMMAVFSHRADCMMQWIIDGVSTFLMVTSAINLCFGMRSRNFAK